jgi:hypothetical protein
MNSKSIEEVAELIANSSLEDAKAIMEAHPTKIMVFGHDIPDFLLLMGNKMKDDEYRALVEAGPAVVMVAKEDMLKLLNRIILLTEANRLADEIIKNHEDERLESLVAFNLCDND